MFSINQNNFFKNLKVLTKLFCHQIPERSFRLKGKYFPVCARCTGLYLGVFSYFIYSYQNYINYSINLTLIAILMIIPTFIDGFTQFIGLRESNNRLRFFSGILGGIGLIMLVVNIKVIFL